MVEKRPWLRRVATPLLVLMGALWPAEPARATQTDNRGIEVVPAPGPVAIDGDLRDWDRSAQVLICYDLETLIDLYSARVAMMHDQEALYVAIDWTDRTPLGNRHDPRYDAGKGWAGDAVQLRLKTDRIAHITAWCYAPRNEPFIHIDYGKSLTEPFKGGGRALYRTEGWELDGGAAMAFARREDGSGYVQEIRIPWSLITHDGRPKRQFRCGIELLWGEGDFPVHRYADNLDPAANNREFFWMAHNAWGPARLHDRGNLSLPEPPYMKAMRAAQPRGPMPIDYTLPREACVTIAIDNARGERVRNLIAALPRSAGAQREWWDGLDDESNLVEPGTYHWKGLYHTGIAARYVMSFANPGNPTWETPDGHGAFYGDHTPPHAAAAGGEFVALACPLGESGRHLIAVTLDGQRVWGLNNRQGFVIGAAGGRASLATDGKILWIAQDGPHTIYRVDLATGQYRPWNTAQPTTQPDAASPRRDSRVLDLAVSPFKRPAPLRNEPNLSAIAVHEGRLAVALTLEERIRILDATTGEERAEYAVKRPRAVAFQPDGRLVALSDDRLVRIEPNGEARAFADQTWPDGYGLACDAEGRVYLTVRGEYHNVQVFSPDGRHLREIGQRGGRPGHGPFIDNAMRNPAQPAIDARGRLWVPEETFNPKRTSVWSLDGHLIRDFVGTTGYAAAGSINPDDPSMAFSDNTVYRINLSDSTWRPVYSLGRSGHPDEIFRPAAGSRARIFNRDGATYVFTTVNRNGTILCTVGREGQWRIAAAFGVVQPRNHPEGGPNFEHPFLRPHVGEIFAWADHDGDGIVQPAELTFSPPPVIDGKTLAIKSGWWGALPGGDGTITHATVPGTHLLQFAITGHTPAGAPIYDPAHPRVIAFETKLGEGMIAGGGAGRVYINASPLTALDSAGRRLFTYPSRHVSVHGSHTARAARPGYLIGPSSVLGTADFGPEIGEIFSLNGNLGENYLFTHDGLWVQSLFKDVRTAHDVPPRAQRGMSLDAITAGGESFGGHFMRTADGRVYLTIGTTDARVIELSGFESIRRIEGTITVTPELLAQAREQQQARAAEAAAEKRANIPKRADPPVIDGKATDWPTITDPAQPALLIGDETRPPGRAALAWDDHNLYLAWRITDSHSAMRNAGQDVRRLFKTGDCVDLVIGDAAAAPTSLRRVLLSVAQGKPVAVLYRPVVPGTPDAERIAFSSPWRTIHFDRVDEVESVRWSTGPIADGWFVEAAIPWQHLGIDAPAPGLNLRGDVGILLADPGGATTAARHYWANKATNLVNDLPGEAELTPALWGTLTLVVGQE